MRCRDCSKCANIALGECRQCGTKIPEKQVTLFWLSAVFVLTLVELIYLAIEFD